MFIEDERHLSYLFRRMMFSNHGKSSRWRRVKSPRITIKIFFGN